MAEGKVKRTEDSIVAYEETFCGRTASHLPSRHFRFHVIPQDGISAGLGHALGNNECVVGNIPVVVKKIERFALH